MCPRSSTLDAVRSVLPLEDLSRLLWWVGTVRPEALRKLEELGCDLGDAMRVAGAEFDAALARWADALGFAQAKLRASGDSLEPRLVWAFWMLFSREGEPESPFSFLLRTTVGYPTDEEAGMSARMGGADA